MRSLLISLLSLGVAYAHKEEVVGFTFAKLEGVRLPKPLSDFSISFDETSQLVYIAGGCDAELGNVYVAEYETFTCSSSSSVLYSFDRSTNSFETLAPMPVARYRHGAVLINGKIWVLGGRDVADVLLSTVDVSTVQQQNNKETIVETMNLVQTESFCADKSQHSLSHLRSMILRLTHGRLTIFRRLIKPPTMLPLPMEK